jgi:hypothetical protein
VIVIVIVIVAAPVIVVVHVNVTATVDVIARVGPLRSRPTGGWLLWDERYAITPTGACSLTLHGNDHGEAATFTIAITGFRVLVRSWAPAALRGRW